MYVDPFFLQKPKELNLNTKISNKVFKVISISQVGNYRLCRWEFGNEYKISGEILYFNKTLIKVGGGSLYNIENKHSQSKELSSLSTFQLSNTEDIIQTRFTNTTLPRSVLTSLYNENNFINLN